MSDEPRTERQRLAAALREDPMTLREVAARFRWKLKEAAREVEHAARSSRPARLRVEEPARCLDCGYVFRERRRLTAPSRCPRCRSEGTTEPVFGIG